MTPKKVSGLKGSSNEVSAKLMTKRDNQAAFGGSSISHTATSKGTSTKSSAHSCAGCNKLIRRDKYLLKALDKFWHENCLRCDRCHGRLGELGSTLYCKSNMNLCRQDYLELFGETGVCSVCEKLICASEMVMRAKQNVYHLECFACQLCNQRFCVGDRFYLCENKIICQYDYEEHVLPIQRSLCEQAVADSTSYQEDEQQRQQQSSLISQPEQSHRLAVSSDLTAFRNDEAKDEVDFEENLDGEKSSLDRTETSNMVAENGEVGQDDTGRSSGGERKGDSTEDSGAKEIVKEEIILKNRSSQLGFIGNDNNNNNVD